MPSLCPPAGRLARAAGPWGRRRIAWAVILAITALALVAGQASPLRAQGPVTDIVLPDLLAIELPVKGMSQIAPTASPLKELLGSASAGGLQITHDQSKPLSLGGTSVTWTAWDGAPERSAARARKRAYVYVFPFGQTPVGLSGDDHATAGNQSAKVVRDASGRLHMGWLDGGRPGQGYRVMYRRAAQDPVSGSLTWEEGPIRVSEPKTEAGNSYVALAASNNAVHFAWGGGTQLLLARHLLRKSLRRRPVSA